MNKRKEFSNQNYNNLITFLVICLFLCKMSEVGMLVLGGCHRELNLKGVLHMNLMEFANYMKNYNKETSNDLCLIFLVINFAFNT